MASKAMVNKVDVRIKTSVVIEGLAYQMGGCEQDDERKVLRFPQGNTVDFIYKRLPLMCKMYVFSVRYLRDIRI